MIIIFWLQPSALLAMLKLNLAHRKIDLYINEKPIDGQFEMKNHPRAFLSHTGIDWKDGTFKPLRYSFRNKGKKCVPITWDSNGWGGPIPAVHVLGCFTYNNGNIIYVWFSAWYSRDDGCLYLESKVTRNILISRYLGNLIRLGLTKEECRALWLHKRRIGDPVLRAFLCCFLPDRLCVVVVKYLSAC